MQKNLDLGVIGNGSISALIDTRGRYVWACQPRFDGDPVFCALLDDKPFEDEAAFGFFEVDLARLVRSEQRYIRNTAVLVTRLEDDRGGVVEIIDFAPRFRQFGRTYRPQAYARLVCPIAGTPRLRLRLRPATDYGARPAGRTHGSNHIRYVGDEGTLRLTTNAPLTYILDETYFDVEQELVFFLGPDETFQRDVRLAVRDMMEGTILYWQTWVRHLALPLEWQEVVIRAAITLKLCQHEETGAIIAAMTTSIPEAAHSGRTWDYRYCWLRDAYYVVQALNRLGAVDILEPYLAYLRNLINEADGGHLQPVYGIGRKARLIERQVPTLPGYRGMGPVRVGNQAHEHLQHDVYGQVVLSVAQAFFDERLLRPMNMTDFELLERMAERAAALHAVPDAGLWELRTKARVHTYSSMMCWAACDRVAKVAAHLGLGEKAAAWSERARAIHDTITARAFNAEAGFFTGSFEGTELDASLLQMVDIRFLPASDPRFRSTLRAIESALVRGRHVMRYVESDDFGAPENAFNICTFWYIEALAASGEHARAREIFGEMLSRRNHVGLLSEDIALADGELWGNYPQTYSLVGLINSAVLLSKPWSEAR
ncbi:MAG: glycoside hydrolase family 15 protein [Alphaproteobacteria bacterium]|nr:glycoside hydrolase family 15 protein [Alphaproteobacteria bacterium]